MGYRQKGTVQNLIRNNKKMDVEYPEIQNKIYQDIKQKYWVVSYKISYQPWAPPKHLKEMV